jgi:imidazolonepropionase-like amidohydrolase
MLALAVTAIVGAMVVDGSGAPPRPLNVVFDGARILSVGASVPAGATIIRAEGHTLTPGFFDLHTHLPYSAISGVPGDWGKVLKAYLYCGVTSVADFGTYPETFEPMRRLLRQRLLPGPRLHLAARITTPLGHGAEGGRGDFFSLEVQTPEQARAATRRWLAYQPDAIKVFTDGWRYGAEPDMTSMEEPTLRAIVDEAHRLDVEVMTHTVTLARAKQAARAGVDVIAHGIGDTLVDDELVQLLRSRATAYVPTLAVYEHKSGPLPPLLNALLQPQLWKLAASARQVSRPPSPTRRRRWSHLIANVALLRAAGARIAAGTDAGVTGTYHGYSTLREMQLLVAAGMTPLEALTAATAHSAAAIHVDNQRGRIAPGFLADLVLIEGAPYENIMDVERIRRVWLDGVEIDRDELRRDITSDTVTPLPPKPAPSLIDNFESDRTSLDTLRVNATDPGADHSTMLFQRLPRPAGGHSLFIQARMAVKRQPYVQLWLPLSRGSIEPVDASAFRQIVFDARGDGAYALLISRRSLRSFDLPRHVFTASPAWAEIRIPLPAKPVDLTGLGFEIARPPAHMGWLELDNVRFQ